MPTFVRSQSDLRDALKEQRIFLRNSCAAYDAGIVAEAKRIATTVYTLCHDGGQNARSILGQLGLKQRLAFISSAFELSPREAPRTRLAGAMYFHQGWIFTPRFLNNSARDVRKHLPFKKWYNEVIMEPLVIDASIRPPKRELCMSRKNLIFHLRSQDGGSHLDPEIENEAYINFGIRNFTGFGYKVQREEETYPVPYPHLASMRQIAWEFEQTLVLIPGGPPLPTPDGFEKTRQNMAKEAATALARMRREKIAP